MSPDMLTAGENANGTALILAQCFEERALLRGCQSGRQRKLGTRPRRDDGRRDARLERDGVCNLGSLNLVHARGCIFPRQSQMPISQLDD